MKKYYAGDSASLKKLLSELGYKLIDGETVDKDTLEVTDIVIIENTMCEELDGFGYKVTIKEIQND